MQSYYSIISIFNFFFPTHFFRTFSFLGGHHLHCGNLCARHVFGRAKMLLYSCRALRSAVTVFQSNSICCWRPSSYTPAQTVFNVLYQSQVYFARCNYKYTFYFILQKHVTFSTCSVQRRDFLLKTYTFALSTEEYDNFLFISRFINCTLNCLVRKNIDNSSNF